jgi:hypothetical protein
LKDLKLYLDNYICDHFLAPSAARHLRQRQIAQPCALAALSLTATRQYLEPSPPVCEDTIKNFPRHALSFSK